MPGPLEGIQVLDVAQLAVGPWAGTLLGQLGAQVIKIEDPRGDPIRNLLPKMNGVGTYYTSVNLNKKNIALNLKDPEELQIALKLAERADIFLENFRPGVIDRLGLGYEALRKMNPRIVYGSASGYGTRGPRHFEGAADGYIRGFTGFDNINGLQGDRPQRFRNRGHIDHTSSAFLVQAILAALLVRERHGVGQKVEISMMQATMVYQTSRIAEYFSTGVSPKPMGSACYNLVPHQAFRTQDGYIAIGVNTQQQWERLCAALGRPGLAEDPRFGDNAARVAGRDALLAVLEPEFAGKTSQEWLTLLEGNDVPCGPFLTFHELLANAQVQANEMIVEVGHPWGKVKVGGTPWRFDKTPAVVLPAPSLDEHRQEIVDSLAAASARSDHDDPPERDLGSPLQGLVVVEMAQGIAAPFAAMQLGDLGAEVIKIEPPEGDWSRRVGPPFLGDEGPVFLAVNRNKKSVVLDTSDVQGVETLKGLIARADVFITDLSPEKSEALSLGSKDLQTLNPRLVHCSVTPFGEKGPLRNRPGGEVVLQAMSDVRRYLGVLGEYPLRLGADAAAMAAGMFAFQGTVAALICRERQGKGQKVEVSHLGSMLALGTQLHAAQSGPSLTGGWHLSAPTDPPSHLPMARDLAVDFGFNERAKGGWEAFCETLGIPEEVAKDPRFTNNLGRTLNHAALRPILERFFGDKTAAEIKKIAEDCGGIGVVSNTYDTLFRDPQVAAMDMVLELEHPTLGTIKSLGLPWDLEKTPGAIRTAPPILGQHTGNILSNLSRH